jgi:hypothetical protein
MAVFDAHRKPLRVWGLRVIPWGDGGRQHMTFITSAPKKIVEAGGSLRDEAKRNVVKLI